MRLIVGAPVANRSWALPMWYQCLARQTRRPDGLIFIHSGQPGDGTWNALRDLSAQYGLPSPQILHDTARPHARADNDRFRTLARLRNRLLGAAQLAHADLFMSLDTDIMLEDPATIERLCGWVESGDCDIAQPLAFLHPQAPRSWTPADEVCWAYNFGWLTAGERGPHRSWQRPMPRNLDCWGQLIRVHIPMGAWVGNRRALACRYEWHEGGEDIGYAQSLETHGIECLADTSLYGWHVWSERHLPTEAVV